MDDADLAARLAENGRRLAEREFSDAGYIDKVASFYSHVLGDRPQRETPRSATTRSSS
jgi:hypothetical protein